ncbi:PD40 domain-containing protein [Candidatus Poribacteria bacterium]|nr:PD40 domain-containing protein [Candidatus Poribacteria bacterium]
MRNIRISLSVILGLLLFLPLNVYAQDYTEWELPNGTFKRLGKGEITGNIIFSPDNSLIAVASSIGVWLYDANTGIEQDLFTNHSRRINSVSFSPDGNTLASSSSGEFLLWDVSTGNLLSVLSAHADEITDLEFSPDGKTLATCSWYEDSSVRLWDVATGRMITAFDEDEDDVTCLEFSPDGKILATGGYGKKNIIKLWDVATGKLDKTIPTNSQHGAIGVPDISFSPDGKTLVSCEGRWNGSIHLWDVATGSLEKTLLGHMQGVNSLDYNKDGSILASGSEDGTLSLWNMDSKTHMNTLIAHTSSVVSVSYNTDGTTLVTGSKDGNIHIWDTQTLEKNTISEHLPLWTEFDFSPNGEEIASIGRDNTLRVWDTSSGKLISTSHGQFDPLSSVSYSPDGETIATGSVTYPLFISIWSANENSVRLWDVSTGKTKATLYGHHSNVSSVAFHPYEPIVAASVRDGAVVLWDTITYHPLWTIPSQYDKTQHVVFSPNGRILVTGESSVIRLWDFSRRELITEISHPSAIGTNIAFSPDGRMIASVSGLQQVYIWDIYTEVQTIIDTGHTTKYIKVAFSPDSKTIITAGDNRDGTIRIWDTLNGELRTVLNGVVNGISDLKFSPDGNTLATLGGDGTILFWDYPTLFTPPRVKEDINNDGVIDIKDLVAVAANFGQTGDNAADVNGDGIVDIADLIMVAGVLDEGNGAPVKSIQNLNLTVENIRDWLLQAQQLNLTDPINRRGIHYLEQFLLQLTPSKTALLPNFPNPFNPETWIPYQLSQPSDVSIQIYSSDGVLIRTLAIGLQLAGTYQKRNSAVYWDGKNEIGESVASGVYFYTLTADEFTATRKMIIRK